MGAFGCRSSLRHALLSTERCSGVAWGGAAAVDGINQLPSRAVVGGENSSDLASAVSGPAHAASFLVRQWISPSRSP